MFKYIIITLILFTDIIFCNETLCMENGIFGPLLEEWTVSSNQFNHREERIMKIPKTEGGFVVSKFATISDRIYNVNDTRQGSKVVNRPQTRPQMTHNTNQIVTSPSREVSETDLYLLSALEKLAYKTDIMEKRLRRLEEMIYYMVAGNKVDIEPCPDNYTRAGDGCYYFGERKFDWQVANKYCKRMGAQLVEFETINEKNSVAATILLLPHLKDKNFWTSGLNPGLLWIWGTSAKPVLDKSDKSEIRGTGRCLGLVYDPAYRQYNYRGQDCTLAQYFICEKEDASVNNGIARLAKQLNN